MAGLARLRQLQIRNAKLRKAIIELSQRQEVLEEFIELEYRDSFKLFMFNRDRMMYALDYTLEDILLQYGKRSPKSLELVRLMRVVKSHQRPIDEKKERRREDLVHPKELKHLRIYINRNTGKIQRDPSQKCKKCHDPGHGFRRCPYKDANARTAAVKGMIQARVEEMKKIEMNDPFITNGYKKRNFKADAVKKAQSLNWRRPEEELTAIRKGIEATSRDLFPVGDAMQATSGSIFVKQEN